jgi:hypothetical protein
VISRVGSGAAAPRLLVEMLLAHDAADLEIATDTDPKST